MKKTMVKATWILLLACAVLPATGTDYGLKTGDLLFQTAGTSEFSSAIDSSTGSTGFAHVGIVWVAPDGIENVIEASPKEGVRVVEAEKFISEAPGVTAMRLEADFAADKVISLALSHIGEPYDWYYLPDNGMMYCSELVYESYLSQEGNHIFTAQPMSFRNGEGEIPAFWITLYEKLGVGVPEGVPGTNPNDLSKDPRLKVLFSVSDAAN